MVLSPSQRGLSLKKSAVSDAADIVGVAGKAAKNGVDSGGPSSFALGEDFVSRLEQVRLRRACTETALAW
jgi:hypothetical protein